MSRKTAAVFASSAQWVAGCFAAVFIQLILILGDPDESDRVLLAVAVFGAAIFSLAAQVLMRCALGRHRTRGSLSRFAGYQLAGIGIGTAIGLGFWANVVTQQQNARLLGTVGAVLLLGFSLLPLRPARHRSLNAPPSADLELVPAQVVEHWQGGPRIGVPQLFVIEFHDSQGRWRRAIHLYQQPVTAWCVVGQLQLDRTRPDWIGRFSVAGKHPDPSGGSLH
ncbi:hypothetical protein [Demetria terragena]|uniref:hypothetical protein n=1 Tax=Demetria terragena TaxID=63959 RepID=UPI000368B499|nr:hypothetical protein [Demetria terragena]